MKMRLKTFSLLMVLLMAASVLGVLGLLTWNRTITWVEVDTNFIVYSDAGLNTVWDSGTTLALPVGQTSFTESYYIRNNGNVPIVVTGTATITGTGTANWPTTNNVTLPVGVDGVLTLKLTGLSGGGSCDVSFTSAAA
jgi:cytoskeletal protein RodZ